eukprot:SAG31_NODE_12168_length_962_cov_1.059096_2_plen_63_part_00
MLLQTGTGTFSRVRIARHKGSGQYLALKILKKVRFQCAVSWWHNIAAGKRAGGQIREASVLR